MKTIKHLYILILFVPVLILAAGCDSTNVSSPEELTEEDLELAAEIIGESLSDESDGIMGTIYDAVSDVSRDGIQFQNSQAKSDDENRSGRGSESKYNASYNPETGEHIIAFRRKIERGTFSKTLAVLMKYIFTSTEGEFLEFPRRQFELVESINFTGLRMGTTNTLRRSSSFERVDTLSITGISASSETLSLRGNHNGSGEMTVRTERRGSVERSYSLFIELADVNIDKALVIENGNLEEGVTGFMRYELIKSHTVNGETREKTVSGSIEFEGDGTALLRFDRAGKLFRIALKNGVAE